ncbi:MAG: methyltransferase domain-containing protein [Anaerolineae bacterium]|nr:methyltransferase domain-containing protein [Anaerolineae bacterium]
MNDPLSVSAKLKTNYEDFYEGESEWRRLGAVDKAKNIVSLCTSYPHRTILEIGAGEGAILQRLSDLGFGEALYGLEISASGVKAISQRSIKALIECRLFDGYTIPYDDKKFDLAVLSHVVEHLEYPRRLLYEASRVAHFVFVEVPLEDNLRLKKDFVFDHVGHINFYSPKTIRQLVQSCDLEVLSQVVLHASYPLYQYQYGSKAWSRYVPKELLLRLAPQLAPFVWTYHSAMVCQKRVS